MSNKTQLQTNNTALDGYIARINAAKEVAATLPEAGGSGGGCVETCTVTITSDSGNIEAYNFTVLKDNGELGMSYSQGYLSTPITIPQVVCNSAIFLAPSYTIPGFSVTNGSLDEMWSYGRGRFCRLTVEANSDVAIHCYNND